MNVLTKIKAAIVVASLPLSGLAAPTIDSDLIDAFALDPLSLQPVLVTYEQSPNTLDIALLQSLGINNGVVMNVLPMVQTVVSETQLSVLAGQSNVVSIYGYKTYELMLTESRPFIGVDNLRLDTELRSENNGVPVSGQGIGVAYVDTGIDATHPDLMLGQSVEQNVFFPLAEVPLNLPMGFLPPIFIENAPISDVEGGHGTFGAGNVAGTGAASGGLYEGVAPGADLIGLVAGNDAGLSNFAIVQAYDYTLLNQQEYNIRVSNNSFGVALGDPDAYDPNDPVNVGSRLMHDSNIAVVFAGGNDGEGPAQINALSVAPWVISVAAGEKNGVGAPAGFSSRGVDNGNGSDTAGFPADPNTAPNLRPDITGPGVDINSARSKGPGVTNVAGTALGQDLDIAPAFLPFYTTSQGTSFAAPHVSGVIALMLEINPNLNPDEIVTILRQTATPMPFTERVVGAGYVDAHNAVRMAANLAEVPHPADLFLAPGLIVDGSGDQTGTEAQDILSGSFRFDGPTDQLVYRMTLADLTDLLPNSRYVQSSVFDGTTVFVSTSVEETGNIVFEYGTIVLDPNTGVNNQTTIGNAAAGMIDGNDVEVRLNIQQINDAVGFDVRGAHSTAPSADTQITIGTSVTGGLLLNADSASGAEYDVVDEETEELDNRGGERSFTERFSGALTPDAPMAEFLFRFSLQRDDLQVTISSTTEIENLYMHIFDSNDDVIEVHYGANGDGFTVEDLPAGYYSYRIGTFTQQQPVDFVITSKQLTDS